MGQCGTSWRREARPEGAEHRGRRAGAIQARVPEPASCCVATALAAALAALRIRDSLR